MNANTGPGAAGEPFNYAEYLFATNAGRADRVAYVDDRGSLSHGGLAQRAQRLAGALLAAGLRREERVLLLAHDSNDWPVSFLGAMYAGIVPVALNTLLSADDYAYVLAHSGARAAIVSAPLLPMLEQAMARRAHAIDTIVVSGADEPEPVPGLAGGTHGFEAFLAAGTAPGGPAPTCGDSIGFWLYSSGSTGKPKGTVHAHASPWWTSELYGKPVLGVREDDVCFSAAKLFFAYGLGNALFFPLAAGASTVLMAERPTPEAVFRRWVEQRPTLFFGAPTGYAGMLAAPGLPEREQVALRLCSSAGEALPAEIGERFARRFGCEVLDGIGSTEMLHVFLSNRPGDVRYGTTGRPVPGYDIDLRDERGRPVPDGEVGDLYIRGPSSALMYWENRDKTRETFIGAWTRSGDKYSRDADGYYTYAGRSDDMLKVSGQYVSPFEVEATLVQHEAVLEAAVIGIEDANGLTRTKAFVVLKSGRAGDDELAAELQAFIKQRLAPHKYPRHVEFIAELPKTATGKIQRFRLRELEREREAH
ncbi:MAG: benzoate-CoA ligase family protein [Burkholderiaceae bacterium]